MKAGPDGKLPYTGVVDCFKKVIILLIKLVNLWYSQFKEKVCQAYGSVYQHS